MPIREDVLVVGGGLAGMMAALAAAETGATVRLVSHKQSTLRHASGLVDVLGYTPDGDLVVDPFEALETLPEGHPYERVGRERVADGLALFDRVAEGYRGSHTRKNALVPTHGGTVKPTARYPETTAAGLASAPRDLLLVGFAGLPDFDAPLVADHLAAADVPFAVRGVTVEFPQRLAADATVTRYAHLLDRDPDVPLDGRPTDLRQALAECVGTHLDGEGRVGLPAVLGEDHTDDIRLQLEAELDADVFEVPMGPPSLPGMRLEATLLSALDDAGVRITTGNPVVGYGADGEVVTSVTVEQGHQRVPYHADQFVLATGGLVGKGIGSDRDGVYEPVFDLDVPHPTDRYDWFEDDAFGDHPFARFGVSVDRDLRPQTAGGQTRFENLRAAGGVLGGADFAAEKSGSGISIATGYAAGTAAGENA